MIEAYRFSPDQFVAIYPSTFHKKREKRREKNGRDKRKIKNGRKTFQYLFF